MIRHVVLLRWTEGTTAEQHQAALDALHELPALIPEIVRYISAVITLVPGDIIYTGTPGEPQALQSGDEVEVEISGTPVLRNRVR